MILPCAAFPDYCPEHETRHTEKSGSKYRLRNLYAVVGEAANPENEPNSYSEAHQTHQESFALDLLSLADLFVPVHTLTH